MAVISEGHFAFWHVMYWGLAIVGFVVNLYLVVIIYATKRIRDRPTNYLFSTIAGAHLFQSFLFTPWFRTGVNGYFDPQFAPFLCQYKPIILDVAFHVELLSLLYYAYKAWKALKSSPSPIDVNITKMTIYIVTTVIVVIGYASSFSWGWFRYVTPLNASEPDGLFGCYPSRNPVWQFYNTYLAFGMPGVLTVVIGVFYGILFKKMRNRRQEVADIFRRELLVMILIFIKFGLSWSFTWLNFMSPFGLSQGLDPTFRMTYGLFFGWWHDQVLVWNVVILTALLPSFRSVWSCLPQIEERKITDTEMKPQY